MILAFGSRREGGGIFVARLLDAGGTSSTELSRLRFGGLASSYSEVSSLMTAGRYFGGRPRPRLLAAVVAVGVDAVGVDAVGVGSLLRGRPGPRLGIGAGIAALLLDT